MTLTVQQLMAAPIIVRTMPIIWRDEETVLAGLEKPQLALFWAIKLGLIERKARWFGRGWKLRWNPDA